MRTFAILLIALLAATSSVAAESLSDNAIRERIVQESIAAYPGSCPCPFNVDRAGHACGARSAFSRPGGRAPICYARDVTQEQVDAYRKTHPD